VELASVKYVESSIRLTDSQSLQSREGRVCAELRLEAAIGVELDHPTVTPVGNVDGPTPSWVDGKPGDVGKTPGNLSNLKLLALTPQEFLYTPVVVENVNVSVYGHVDGILKSPIGR